MRSGLVLAFFAGLWLVGCKSGRVQGYRLVPQLAYDYAEVGPYTLRERASALRTGAAGLAEPSKSTLTMEAKEYEKAAQLLEKVDQGDILFTDRLFFTVEPLIAFDGDLATTAIPALGVNWRFLEEKQNPLAAQVVMGGALNPQASGRDVGAAIGLGFSHPVGQKGSISLGYVWWDEAGDGEDGFYIGITLGDFGKKAATRP